MPINTKMKSLLPRKQQYAKEQKLPSHGYTCPEAFPNGNILIYPWDTEIDDFLMKASAKGDPDVLFKVLERICNLGKCAVDNFVFSELMTVLLMARSLGSGGMIHYISDCPQCRRKEDEHIQVPEELEVIGEKGPNYPGFDTVTLPTCQDVIQIRPLLVRDEKVISERPSEQRDALDDAVVRKLLPIVGVNDSKPDTLEELSTWYFALPPEDARYLAEQEDLLSPQLNRRIPHSCGACGKIFHHTLQFDQEFFRGRGEGKSRPSLEKNVRDGVAGKGIHPGPSKDA